MLRPGVDETGPEPPRPPSMTAQQPDGEAADEQGKGEPQDEGRRSPAHRRRAPGGGAVPWAAGGAAAPGAELPGAVAGVGAAAGAASAVSL